MKHSKIKVLEEFDWIKQRSTIYLGSTEEVTHEFYFAELGKFQTSSYLPACHKLFDEVIENSVDEFTRTKGQYANKIDITVEKNGEVTVCDNGRGLEIEKHHQFTDIYVPEVIFTKLRSGSNFEDIRNGIGVNGLGAVLTVLFSNSFKVTTYSHSKRYIQSFDNMLSDISVPKITPISPDKHGTEITFTPNFEFFKTTNWNLDLLRKKIVDLSFNFPGIKFTFNGDKVNSRAYKDLVSNYATEYVIEETPTVKLIVCSSEGDFKHHSLVNGANTFLGGTHIDYISSEIVNNIRPALEKKYKLSLKPSDIKNHISVFCQLQLANPIFTSQTKEQIINKVEEVKPLFTDILNDKFYKKILKNELLVLSIIAEAQMKQEIKEKLDIKAKQKNIVKKKVAKLVEANSKFRDECILHLCEGDSAISGGGAVRNPAKHAFLPLRGKVLNVHDMSPSDVLHNSEIQDILNAVGLRIGEKAVNLRYGKICLLTDADEDGFSISGLLINFFYKYWKELFDQKKVVFLKTPLFIAEKNLDKIYIYNKLEYEKMKPKLKGYHVSYFKGLAGLTEDSWDYFLNKNPQYVTVTPDDKSKETLKIVFGEESSLRKEWLTGE